MHFYWLSTNISHHQDVNKSIGLDDVLVYDQHVPMSDLSILKLLQIK